MDHAHINAGARGFERLVIDDRDRRDLVDRLRGALGSGLLAWCLMDTHVHVVVEGIARGRDRFAAALEEYARVSNRRHRRRGELLRGPPVAIEVASPFELGRTIRYVHENPVAARIVQRSIDWLWSSAQGYAGLVRADAAAAARARRSVDARALRMLEQQLPLADALPLELPERSPRVLLDAAALVLSIDPALLEGGRRGPRATAGRDLLVRLGLLEGYQHRQLAALLGVTRQRVTQHSTAVVDDIDVRRARTLLREGLVFTGAGVRP